MPFSTRSGRPDDIGALVGLLKDCWPSALRSDKEDYEGRLKKAPEHMIIGLVDGKPKAYASSFILALRPTIQEWQGMIRLDEVDSVADYHDPSGGCFYLSALAVHPRYRLQGMGRRLFMETAELAASKGHDTMYFITNPDKLEYFRKFGARMIDHEMTPFYGVPHAWHAFDVNLLREGQKQGAQD